MSWWSSKSPIEQQIEAATSEDIPTGEQNLALNLEICDEIRSKRVPAKDAVKLLRKRLYVRNPNVQVLTLHLLDLCVKNGGSHFLEEVATKEFMDAYNAQVITLVNQDRNDGVVDLMLEYIQAWALMTKDRTDLSQIYKTYQALKSKPGIVFQEPSAISSTFADSATAPDWVDSDTCMKSGRPFTFYNRKHHCRNCGGVFLQEYCSNFIPLPHFGINEPVRVCDDCKVKLADKYTKSKPRDSSTRGFYHSSNNVDLNGSFDQDLRRALEQSLQDSAPEQLTSTMHTEEMDEDMKAAIAASLADMERVKPESHAPQQETYSTHTDKQVVEELRQALESAHPKDVFLNPKFAALMASAEACQPRVSTELGSVANKLQTLEDLHGRLSAISSYYDRMLDIQLHQAMPQTAPVTAGSVQGMPQVQPQVQPQIQPHVPQMQPQVSTPVLESRRTSIRLRPSAPAYNPVFATYSAPPAPMPASTPNAPAAAVPSEPSAPSAPGPTAQSAPSAPGPAAAPSAPGPAVGPAGGPVAAPSAPPAPGPAAVAPAVGPETLSAEDALSQIPSAPTQEPEAESEPEPEPVLIEL